MGWFYFFIDYDYNTFIPNDLGIKQRTIDLAKYLIPGVQAIGDDNIPINNYQRETSVFIKTKELNNSEEYLSPLPFPNNSINVPALGITDKSIFKFKFILNMLLLYFTFNIFIKYSSIFLFIFIFIFIFKLPCNLSNICKK